MSHNRQGELDRILALPVTPEMLDSVQAIVAEQCITKDGDYFSGFIGVFADALRLLGEHGRVSVTTDNGGRVVEARKCMTD